MADANSLDLQKAILEDAPFFAQFQSKNNVRFLNPCGKVFITDMQQWQDFVEAALAIVQHDAGLKEMFLQLRTQILQSAQNNMAQHNASHQEKRHLVHF